MKKRLKALIACAKILGLPQCDLDTASDFLINIEYGLCFETVITQMYENDIEIDINIYMAISEIAKEMSLPQNDYLVMEDLIRVETEISKEANSAILCESGLKLISIKLPSSDLAFNIFAQWNTYWIIQFITP